MCKGLASLPTCCLERYTELTLHREGLLGYGTSRVKKLTALRLFLRPTLEECLRWKESFEKLLSSKYGLCAFTAFLVSEFSEENIAFYFACEDYRTTKSPGKLPAKAQKIYDEFIGSDAPREINIDHETRDITRDNMLDPSPSCFNMAQYKIYMLMAKDCYPRFLRSPAYGDLVCQAKPGDRAATQPRREKAA
uniref:Regulator of G protein signaling 16 n=1 Tax=Scophthalmus maximus TaxID=52904 RepID=A0A8D3BWI3_SCOMX